MSLLLTAAHYTDTGLREQNEDFAGLVLPDASDLSDKGWIAAIADGVSGSEQGREAAQYSVQRLLADYYASPDIWSVRQSLDSVMVSINRWLYQQGLLRSYPSGMATTLTGLVLHERHYYFSHIGDTRLYLLRGDVLKCLTIDHVSDIPQQSHVLTRALGISAQQEIDHGMGEIQPGDIFLLATDGVWSVLPNDDICWHLSELTGNKRSAEATAKLMVDAALAAGSTDNASALVVRIDRLNDNNLRDDSADKQQITRRPMAS